MKKDKYNLSPHNTGKPLWNNQEYCQCKKTNIGMTVSNSKYCRECNKWIIPKQ